MRAKHKQKVSPPNPPTRFGAKPPPSVLFPLRLRRNPCSSFSLPLVTANHRQRPNIKESPFLTFSFLHIAGNKDRSHLRFVLRPHGLFLLDHQLGSPESYTILALDESAWSSALLALSMCCPIGVITHSWLAIQSF